MTPAAHRYCLYLVAFDESSEVANSELTISNEDYSEGHFHGHALYASEHVLVSDQISPSLAPVGSLDNVRQVVQENTSHVSIKPQRLVSNDIISGGNFQDKKKMME